MLKERFASPLARSCFVAIPGLLLVFGMTSNTTPTSAQILPVSSIPNDSPFAHDNQPIQSPVIPEAPPTNIPPPTIEIASLVDGQQVSAGELEIEGISFGQYPFSF